MVANTVIKKKVEVNNEVVGKVKLRSRKRALVGMQAPGASAGS